MWTSIHLRPNFLSYSRYTSFDKSPYIKRRSIQTKVNSFNAFIVSLGSFHVPLTCILTWEDGIATLKRTNKSIAHYFDEMGVSKELLNLSNSVDKNSIKFLNEKELQTYLPFAVSEYAAILPIKIRQSMTSVVNLVSRSMDLAIKEIGPEKNVAGIP